MAALRESKRKDSHLSLETYVGARHARGGGRRRLSAAAREIGAPARRRSPNQVQC